MWSWWCEQWLWCYSSNYSSTSSECICPWLWKKNKPITLTINPKNDTINIFSGNTSYGVITLSNDSDIISTTANNKNTPFA